MMLIAPQCQDKQVQPELVFDDLRAYQHEQCDAYHESGNLAGCSFYFFHVHTSLTKQLRLVSDGDAVSHQPHQDSSTAFIVLQVQAVFGQRAV